jgi:uncharacterized protein (DUF58 family)
MSHRRISITREGIYYLLVVALVSCGAMMREVNLLLVLSGMLLGPLIFNFHAVLAAFRGLAVRRKLPQEICAGDMLVANVSIGNTRRRRGSWAVVVEDRLLRQSDAEEPSFRPAVLFPYVKVGQVAKGTYRGRLARRGRYLVGPLRATTRFPFGLFSCTIEEPETETLTVFPKLGQLTQHWAARRREAFAGEHRRELRPGQDGDFHGLRPWRAGDNRRWIHWRSAARTGSLFVRQFEQPRNRDVAVLLDLWRPEEPRPADDEHVELAVSFAATVLTDLCRKGGGALHLIAGDPHPRCTSGPASPAVVRDMMHRLATIEPQPADRLAELVSLASSQLESGTEILLVSTRKIAAAEGDSPIFAADSSSFPVQVRRAAKIGTVPRERLPRGTFCIDASSKELERYFFVE